RQLIDLVAQAQRAYWDLVFAAEDIKVKQRSMDLAQKTLSDNEIQVRIGTLAPIDVVQAESEVANRRVQYVTSTYTEVQTQDQVKKLITSQGDPGLILAKLIPSQVVPKPQPSDVPPIEQAIKIALENRPEIKQLQLEVRNALTQVDMNRARIEAATKASELSERRLEAEQKKFDLGASTIRFVLEEQRNVAQAQTDELQAIVNYTKALVDIDRAMGMTLKKNNIEIEKTLISSPTAR